MHSFHYSPENDIYFNDVTFHFDGGLPSGSKVKLNVAKSSIIEIYSESYVNQRVEIEIHVDALLALIAYYHVLPQKISKLEQADVAELLGVIEEK
jgi:hypothetical protein